MPVISRYAALKDMENLKETFTSSLTLGFCLTIPAAVGLVLLAEPVIRLIFEHGSFDGYATTKTAEALSYYALGLFAYSSVKIMVPIFYALDKTRYPVAGSFLAMAVNVVVVLLTIDALGHKALAFSISCAMIINFLFLSSVLYWQLEGYSIVYLVTGLAKVVLAAGIMGGWLFYLEGFMAGFAARGIINGLGVLLVLVVSGAGLYGLVLYGLRLKELHLLVERTFARLSAR